MNKKTPLTLTLLCILTSSLYARPLNFFADGSNDVHSKNYKAAAEKFRAGVNAGDPASMDYMGWMFLEGRGVWKSAQIAEGFFREAAALGNGQACRNLGNIYYDGRATEPSITEALKWWQLAADRGANRAAFSLATILYLGTGIPQDKDRALKTWTKAANNGDTPSSTALLFVQANEDLNKVNTDELRKLANKNCSSAKNLLRAVELKKAGKLNAFIPGHFEQQAHNFCAVASTTMLLKTTGLQVTHFDIARARPNHKWSCGSRWPEMAEVAAKHNIKLSIHSNPYTNQGFMKGIQEVISELNKGRAVVVDVLATAESVSAHSILLTGYSKESRAFTFLNSALPFPGIEVMTTEKFKELWRSRGFIPDNETLLRAYMKIVPPDTPAN